MSLIFKELVVYVLLKGKYYKAHQFFISFSRIRLKNDLQFRE
jgi:hypothetical protein